jgi:4-hydroxy 2-oxovalerate aldolase
MSRKIDILDCTLRDGSYLINFQFNCHDTGFISNALESSGIKYIEVGHGLGLDAGSIKGQPLEDDIAYIKSAKVATNKALIGVFYIPGIGQLASIKKALDAGLDFIRIGVNIFDYQQAKESVEYAKSLGLEVWINLMKTYAMPYEEFKLLCLDITDYGADKLAIVDSAGGMTPSQVTQYVDIARKNTRYSIGFHGHNNLQMAIANCLAAVEAGADSVDTTLYGMGRNGGNAATEIISSLLTREGYNLGGCNNEMLIELADKVIAPIAPKEGRDYPVELASGVNYFHSSYLNLVSNAATENDIDRFKIILSLPNESHKVVTNKMCQQTAAVLKTKKTDSFKKSLVYSDQIYINSLIKLKKYLYEVAAKTKKETVISIALNTELTKEQESGYRISSITAIEGSLVGHIEVANSSIVEYIVNELVGEVKYWVLENALYQCVETIPGQPKILYYNEKLLIHSVLYNELSLTDESILCINNDLSQTQIEDSEFSSIADRLSFKEKRKGNIKYILSEKITAISPKLLANIHENSVIILLSKCEIENGSWNVINQKNITLIRLNYTKSLAYDIKKVINYYQSIYLSRGKKMVDGIQVVSAGVIAEVGTTIVDDITSPSMIIGETDGQGGVLNNPVTKSRYQVVSDVILNGCSSFKSTTFQ